MATVAPGSDAVPTARPSIAGRSPAIGGQPILVLGGFLIGAEAYAPMLQCLRQESGQPVQLVAASRGDWLLTTIPFGWARLLDRVAERARSMAAASPTGRITLVGHSSGGIMLRLFLSDLPLQGRRYGGRALASGLVMLGSPHTALRATAMRRRVAEALPGAFHDRDPLHPVRYLSVAGDLELGGATRPGENPQATDLARRLAPTAYRNSTGNPEDRGDGLVPVSSALLAGSEPLVLAGVAHGGAFGPIWYGTPGVVEQWWAAFAADNRDPHPA